MDGAVRLRQRSGDVLGVKRSWHTVLTGPEAKRFREEDNLTPATAKEIPTEEGEFGDYFGATRDGGPEWLEAHARALDAGPSSYFAARQSPTDVFSDELSYCKRHNLWMHGAWCTSAR